VHFINIHASCTRWVTTTDNTTVTLPLKAVIVKTLSKVKIQIITRRGH
jgi:hypothetical protein